MAGKTNGSAPISRTASPQDPVVQPDALAKRLKLLFDTLGDLRDGNRGQLVRTVDPLARIELREAQTDLRAQIRRDHNRRHTFIVALQEGQEPVVCSSLPQRQSQVG
jgi:hypothetical protein